MKLESKMSHLYLLLEYYRWDNKWPYLTTLRLLVLVTYLRVTIELNGRRKERKKAMEQKQKI